jgi:hypothetical protein
MVHRAPKPTLTFDIPRIIMGGTECQQSLCRIERRRNQPAVGSSRGLPAATRPPAARFSPANRVGEGMAPERARSVGVLSVDCYQC